MNTSQLSREIFALNLKWQKSLEFSADGSLPGASEDGTLEAIAAGLQACAKEIQEKWSVELALAKDAQGWGPPQAAAAAALTQALLGKEGLLGTVAAAALQKGPQQVTLKKLALDLCRTFVSLELPAAAPVDSEALAELTESCLSAAAVDPAHKVKQAALRLLRAAFAPETSGGPWGPPWTALPLPAAALQHLLHRLAAELSCSDKRAGSTVRAELLLLLGGRLSQVFRRPGASVMSSVAALLSRLRNYPELTGPWLLPVLQQITCRLGAPEGKLSAAPTEALGALEALQQLLHSHKTLGALLPAEVWGRVYAYAVTLGAPEGQGGAQGGPPGGPQGSAKSYQQQLLQPAALALLAAGAETFAPFLDKDISQEFAAALEAAGEGELPPNKLGGPAYCAASSSSSSSSSKQCSRWGTLLDRLLGLAASPQVSVANAARRALARIMRCLCGSVALGAPGAAAAGAAAAGAAAGAAAAAGSSSIRGSSSSCDEKLKRPLLLCAVPLQLFGARLVSELCSASLLPAKEAVSQPESWWQQQGCRALLVPHYIGMLSAAEQQQQQQQKGLAAARACLLLASTGCGPAWQQRHGPSVAKQTLHFLSSAGETLCLLLGEKSVSFAASSVAPAAAAAAAPAGTAAQVSAAGSALSEETADAKRRRVFPQAQQQQQQQQEPEGELQPPEELPGLPVEESQSSKVEKVLLLPASFCRLIENISISLFKLHAEAGALPRALLPKAAAALGAALRALLRAAAAETAAAAVAAAAVLQGTGDAQPFEATEKDTGEDRKQGQLEEAKEAAAANTESLKAGGAAAAAAKSLINQTLLLALGEAAALQPPPAVSVAGLWRAILGLEGEANSSSSSSSRQAGPLGKRKRDSWGEQQTDPGSNEVRDAAAAAAWLLPLSRILLESFYSFFSLGLESSGSKRTNANLLPALGPLFAQALLLLPAEAADGEAAASCFLFQLQAASLPASCSSGGASSLMKKKKKKKKKAAAKQRSSSGTEAGAAEGLLSLALSSVESLSLKELLQRLAVCFCCTFSAAFVPRRLLCDHWSVASAAASLGDCRALHSPACMQRVPFHKQKHKREGQVATAQRSSSSSCCTAGQAALEAEELLLLSFLSAPPVAAAP
ncbi:hypothetical protein, conserved [Eimeria tenella]|uniref:Uncharacterized protein n=1 Tax=Eimeria tenella TaxID=5802 RepID=U6KTS9_EIMTE|nr:hypothetical protein, conserved [Eimeria tenella]CDJ41371.1 hypothetical protein, conserved [Eimeria tenella]|eukprot:XP_013232121.1 hypothetical protein, conserved [Eimeria tenella]